jgi:hypothetical protein
MFSAVRSNFMVLIKYRNGIVATISYSSPSATVAHDAQINSVRAVDL